MLLNKNLINDIVNYFLLRMDLKKWNILWRKTFKVLFFLVLWIFICMNFIFKVYKIIACYVIRETRLTEYSKNLNTLHHIKHIFNQMHCLVLKISTHFRLYRKQILGSPNIRSQTTIPIWLTTCGTTRVVENFTSYRMTILNFRELKK